MSTYRDLISEMYIHGYELAEDSPTFRVPENFDRYSEGSGWQAYKGGNDWENGTTGVAVYLNPEGYNKDMARIWFEVKFPPHLEEYVSSNKGWNTPSSKAVKKWGDKASRRWMRETVNIRRGTRQYHGAHDGYNHEWVERKPWRECFLLALDSPKMKPFVKNYGVDKTKWVGMKRSMPEQLNESGKPSKYWWMDPEGELIPVPYDGHAVKGAEIVKNKTGKITLDVYKDMNQLGYIRVGFAGLWGQYVLEVNYEAKKQPNARQWRALKDLAIEMGADDIKDLTSKRNVRVNESRILFENFHENKEWFLYEGENTITAVFEDNSRHTFKVHFHDQRLREDRDKHRTKAARTWKRLATEIRKSAGMSKTGNPIVIPWQECFQKALQDPMMLEFVDDLRATPIFESRGWFPTYNVWLHPEGIAYKGGSHDSIASTFLRAHNMDARFNRDVYDKMYRMGFARIVVGDNAYPLIVDMGSDLPHRLTRKQREWVEDMSFELGLKGEYQDAYGQTRTLQETLNEMTYDELHQSMQDFKTRKDLRLGTKTGSDSRDAGAKQVGVRSLRVVSTVGRDGNEHETSMFSYKSRSGNPNDARTAHQRWQGHIRFIENSKGGAVAPTKDDQDVEVNCNCPDYRYVWAKANSDVDAGVTAKDGGTKYQTQAGAGKPVNIFEAEEPVVVPTDKRWNPKGGEETPPSSKVGGNDNNGTYGKKIRNPQNTPGLCKHLIALADYIEKKTKAEPVAPPEPGQEEPDVVAKPSKLKKTGKPVNIFESIKQFALQNPTFDVPYED